MILKLSIIGLFIVLIAVIMVTYYTQLEGFNNIDVKGATDATTKDATKDATNATIKTVAKPPARTGGVTSTPEVPVPTPGAVTITVPINTDKPATPVAKDATQVPVPMVAASSAADLSAGTSIAPTTGHAAGPAPYSTLSSAHKTALDVKAAKPVRHDVAPQVNISDTGYDAMSFQQKSDLLSNIQKIFRNELLSSRSTDSSVIDKSNTLHTKSSSTAQGTEYNKASVKSSCETDGEDEYRCPKNPDGSCPPVPDMTQYIKKDAIPCWGCSIDY